MLEQAIGGPAIDSISFEHLETAARTCALRIAARIIESAFNADHSDYEGPVSRCVCGHQARYAGRKEKMIVSVIGEMTLSRAYYWCEQCGTGWFPRDRRLYLDRGSLSAGLTRIVGATAAFVSFKEADELISALAGVTVGAKQVERTAEALGAEIAAEEQTTPCVGMPCSSTLYLGMDGTGVPMRKQELMGRPGKQADGSAKTREVKLVTVWSADGRDKEGIPVRDVGSVTYNAAIESAAVHDTDDTLSDFAYRVEREAARRGFNNADRRVIIGDGAKWIWNIADELFPSAIQIVDLYHAKGAISTAAREIFGVDSEYGQQWAKKRRDELEEGKIDDLLDALQPHLTSHKAARSCRTYILNNKHRMRYPLFKRQGLCTSSGVVEAGCKLAIGTRLKRAGMHWTLQGANSIIALRCWKLSNRYDDFWEKRGAA